MKTAEEYLEEKGINPIEPIFWDTGTEYLTNSDVMTEFAYIYANAKLDEAAEKATTKTEKRLVKNHVLNNLNPTGIRMEFTVVDKQSILSLKDKV